MTNNDKWEMENAYVRPFLLSPFPLCFVALKLLDSHGKNNVSCLKTQCR
jgi:hypothetical protein